MKLCMGCMNHMEEQVTKCPYCGFDETTLRQESYYLDPGTVVGGRYIVGRVIRYGGHTVSYLGMDAAANRKVMVKEYLPSDFSTRSEGEQSVTIYSGDAREQFEQGLTNFLNEANRIQHLSEVEGIAQIYDCVAENDTGYVISEYVEGSTLREVLDTGRNYSVEEASQFISQILMGLSQVHPLDIVHCDISPESIMVAHDGSIKLLDFGATRYVTTANSKSLAIILKQGYAPEEQYRSQGVRGPWTDVYAVGAVMYRMITGVTPQESVERALVDELKEPSRLGIKIPENVENALMNSLNVYQQDRTPSAQDFLKELHSPAVKRIRGKKRGNETGKLPLWAKGLVACLFCVVIAGGILLYRMTEQEDISVSSAAEKMIDLSGMTLEEAGEYAERLNRDHKGWDIKVEEGTTVYDADKQKNGTIASQTVPTDTNFTKLDQEKERPELKEALLSLKMDKKGRVKGTIPCTIYSNEYIQYEEIKAEKNAYALAMKLGIKTEDGSKQFLAEESKDKEKKYYDLARVVYSGSDGKPKEITYDDLKNKNGAISDDLKAEDEKISVEGIEIHYYVSDFFYWEKGNPGEDGVLGDYRGKYIEDLSFQMYRKINETKRKKIKNKYSTLSGSHLADQSYISFDQKYGKGYIFAQKVDPGKKLDGSKRKDPVLLVVGEYISYQGRTGAEVKREVLQKKLASDQAIKIVGDPGQEVASVRVIGKDDKEINLTFKREEVGRIEITTKEKVVPNTNAKPPKDPDNRTPTQIPGKDDLDKGGG